MRFRALIFLMFLVAELSTTGFAADTKQRPIKVTGVYSDLYFNKKAGDLLGTEIFIFYAGGGYRALIQISEGEPQEPLLVPVEVAGDRVSFLVLREEDGDYDRYEGRVTSTEYIGAIPGYVGQANRLKRKPSYWQ